jgi:hypothetical protein
VRDVADDLDLLLVCGDVARVGRCVINHGAELNCTVLYRLRPASRWTTRSDKTRPLTCL